jgi:hypothetical protein
MEAATKQDIANAIAQGAEIVGDSAAIAAPILSVYNPVAGAALAAFAPLAVKFIVTEAGIFIQYKDMTVDEQKAALTASKF